MVTVAIGEIEKPLQEVTPNWINDQVNRRRRDGVHICVRVAMKKGSINMVLFTPACGGGGGDRSPNEQEKRILELWEKFHLNEDTFAGEDLVAFLNQIRDLI